MNKILLAAIAFFAISNISEAQGFGTIGDKISFGHSWTVGNRPGDSKRNFHPSVQIGRSATYNFNNNVGIGFGTFFSTEGGSYKISDDRKLEHRTNYLRVPVFATFNLGDANRKVQPRISVGPSVGFLIGGKSFREKDNGEIDGMKTVKAMKTKVDAGVNASLGFNVRVKDGIYLNHDINYYHGLVAQEPNANVLMNGQTYTNRGIGMSMGFQVNPGVMKKSMKSGWKGKRMHR